MPSIEVKDLWKSYGSIIALRGVNLRVSDREYFCLLGPTGAGKTTLLKIIAGLLKQDRGEVLIDGVEVSSIPPELRGASYMPQGYALFPHMTVWENVSYGLSVREESLSQAEEILKLVGLWERRDSYPYELSGGQQQRIALARALASGSQILLLDEPLSALDALLNLQLRFELRKLAKELGLTVIHVTHNAEEALSIADKIAILRKGKIQQIGCPSEVYGSPANLFTANFLGEINMFEGRLTGFRGRMCIFKVKNLGELYTRRVQNIGLNVVIAYRPEDVEVAINGWRDENFFRGFVETVENMGFYRRVMIAVNGLEILAYLWIGAADIREGDSVYVHLPPSKALIFPYPKEGLEKALLLE
ncbi:MAG: ABC transporter ATP-binding protein [Thermoprotei archaeon]|nr:MAG: ABC transporter ATP-binding protein [Thermoprotei archaeon]